MKALAKGPNLQHMIETVYIPAATMQDVFESILLKVSFTPQKASACAHIFTTNSLEGVYTHGVNRFPRFIQNVKDGYVLPNAEAAIHSGLGGLEQWNGNLGPGMLNAVKATERAMELASDHAIGCVAMANTNHWMRGGYYGWLAAKKNFVFIGWTNTIANMPAWNAVDNKLGNNPIVFSIPYNDEAIVLDMAMSQFSFGSMEQSLLKKEKLPVFGGFDREGKMTFEPQEIISSKRPMPIGYWKGAGMALMLDVLATVLSAGFSTKDITMRGTEYALSQVFIAIDLNKLSNFTSVNTVVENIIRDYKESIPEGSKNITFPGERVVNARNKNKEQGIPVLKTIWEEIARLHIG
jgi:3-dehydro-L-gulonate 2-dehydrogenase